MRTKGEGGRGGGGDVTHACAPLQGTLHVDIARHDVMEGERVGWGKGERGGGGG